MRRHALVDLQPWLGLQARHGRHECRLQVQIEVNAQKSGRDSAARNDVVETVVHLVLPIKSELTTKVQTAIKDGEETCNVFISGCTVAGSDGGCCDLTVANTARAIEVNAIADAGAPPLPHLCHTRAAM